MRNWRRHSLQVLPLLVFLSIPTVVAAQDFDQLNLDLAASGLTQPIGLANAGDSSDRLFIIEQAGVIRILNTATNSVNATPFIDISTRVDSERNEQGLLGLAFHPDFANNGHFYVNYTRDPGPGQDLTVVSRFTVSAGDSDIADAGTEIKLLEIPQDASNHNGGDLHFGPDGYLYIAMGDGGGGDDQYGHAQDINSLKGKMLRIDVDGTPVTGDVLCGLIKNYGIPDGNPFTSADGCDEIWSYGLRNPWRFSFDRLTGDMLIGDVGQNTWEEIDFEPANTPGLNYGWSCREGAHDFPDGNDCVSSYVDPVLEYDHGSGCSVTGGYVYRGSATAFNGYYFYGDYCSDRVWLGKNTGAGWQTSEWTAAAAVLGSISSFGEAENGDIYIADRSGGKIFHIQILDDVIFADSFEINP
jgi:glucose/arabinose dehydrogenase